jgi:hypothetical protein
MTYKITILVKGGDELENDLKNGHVESGMAQDVFPDEEIVGFDYVKMPEVR